jgi:ATPase subunit of ABC transporter with duplicated ATPase domains
MISHNKEFYSSVCKEEWICADGQVVVQGVSTERELTAAARKKKFEKELEEILERQRKTELTHSVLTTSPFPLLARK